VGEDISCLRQRGQFPTPHLACFMPQTERLVSCLRQSGQFPTSHLACYTERKCHHNVSRISRCTSMQFFYSRHTFWFGRSVKCAGPRQHSNPWFRVKFRPISICIILFKTSMFLNGAPSSWGGGVWLLLVSSLLLGVARSMVLNFTQTKST
jgi:hypothetical protein